MTSFLSRRGFTLLEVLVCVAIVTILAAMLLPAIRGGGCGSVGVQCMSNQKQIAIAALLYQSDNQGAFPNFDSTFGNDGPVSLALVTNYVKQTNVFMCPFVVRQREAERSWYQTKFVPVLDASFFRSNGNDYAYYDGVITNVLTNAFIADRFAWTNRFAPNLPSWNHAKGRINAAFVDGHVESLRADRIIGRDYDPAWSVVQDPILR